MPYSQQIPATPENTLSHPEEGFLTIGKMAALCGVTVRTLRYYEELDLIAPVCRGENKYRLYSQWAMKRVRAVQTLQDIGYSLEAIQQVLGPYAESATYSKQDRIQATATSLQAQQRFLDEKLLLLKGFREEMDQRLNILQTICTPCLSQHPQSPCPDQCDYRGVHSS